MNENANPYFIVYRDGEAFQQKLYQSEVQNNCRGKAIYRIFTFGFSRVKSMKRDLKIEFWDGETFIGIFKVIFPF